MADPYHLPAGPKVQVAAPGRKREAWELRADPAERFKLIFGRYATSDECRALPEPGMYRREADYLSALETWIVSPVLGVYFDHTAKARKLDPDL